MGSFLGDIGKNLGLSSGPNDQGISPEAIQALTGNPVAAQSAVQTLLGGNEQQDAPQTPSLGDIAAASDVPADAVVEGFKPKKMNFWKALGDQLLMHWGNKAYFAPQLEEDNMAAAMEGFTQEPLQAIQRMAQIDQPMAWKLYNEYLDNKRGDAAQDRLLGKDEFSKAIKQQDAWAKLTRVLYGANPNNYGLVKQIYNNGVKRLGITDAAELPEEFNPDTLQAMANSDVPITAQMMNEYRNKMLDLNKQKLGETIRYHDIQDQNADNAETGRNSRNATNEAGRNSRAANSLVVRKSTAKNAEPSAVMTKYGPGEVSPSGNTLRVKVNGGFVLYRKSGTTNGRDNWIKVQQ